LAGEVSLDRDAALAAQPKSAGRRALAGQSVQRLDIPDKVFARPRFIHDLVLPGLLPGRVLRPECAGAPRRELRADSARVAYGVVAVVRDGNFVGVVGDAENSAETALRALRKGATWSSSTTLPDESDLAAFLKSQPVESTVIDTRQPARTNAG